METAGDTGTKRKHRQVYDQLVSILTTRPYKVGDRLPSERDFAAELNVNVLTVRRAFRDLIAADFVTKRVGSGTYLNREITSNWHDHAVNLVIDINCNGAIQKLFEQYGPPVAEKYHREYRFVHTSASNVRELVRSCVQYRQPTIFCGTLPSYREFSADIAEAPELFVSAGALGNGMDLPAVIGADAVGIDMLMIHLRELGHRRIAFITSGPATGISNPASIRAIQKKAWQTRLGTDFDPALYCSLDMTPYAGDQIVGAYEEIRKILADSDFSAAVCATDEIMYGVMAALREAGRKIPGDVSVVSIGNTNLSRFANPPVTGVDLNLKGHLDEAFSLLFRNLEHPERKEMLRTIAPVLMVRQSTAGPGNKTSKKES